MDVAASQADTLAQGCKWLSLMVVFRLYCQAPLLGILQEGSPLPRGSPTSMTTLSSRLRQTSPNACESMLPSSLWIMLGLAARTSFHSGGGADAASDLAACRALAASRTGVSFALEDVGSRALIACFFLPCAPQVHRSVTRIRRQG